MLGPDKSVKADVVVVGGGIAGCLAAITAKEALGEPGSVVLVDKGYVGRSGQSPFAAGIFTAFDPEFDDLDTWLQEIITWGEFLNDQAWCKKLLTESMAVAKMLDTWATEDGIKVFEKYPDGASIRRQSRGHYHTKHLIIHSLPLMQMLRRRAVRAGVEVFDRVMVTDILTDIDNVPRGVLGIAYRDNQVYYFEATAIVLAASGSGFKSTFLGHQSLTGDLQAAALEAGAVLRNMEQYASNTTARQFDIHGLNLFVSIGGKFINRLGEDFMFRYHPILGSRARLQDLVLAFCREVIEGRGPIYLDMRGASPEDRRLCREILPETFLLWDRAGIDPFKQPLEWMPASYATLISGGGLHINIACETNLPHLFAAGDITCIPPHGTYSIGGLNMAFCAVSGRQAGESAARLCSEERDHAAKPVPQEMIADRMSEFLAYLDGPRTLHVKDVVRRIQELIVPLEAGYLKSPNRLESCLQEADRIEKEDLGRLGASCGHELVRVLECRSMVRVAQAMVKASLLRTESRGFHFRQDYPLTDNVNWFKWLMVVRLRGTRGVDGLCTYTESVPTPYYRPQEDYSLPPGIRRDR